NMMQGVAVPTADTSYLCSADADSVIQHGFKHRLQIGTRAGDNAQHLRRRRLLLQRFSKFDGSLAQLVQQPRILDGDDGLGGEVRYQFNLFIAEWPDFLAVNADHSYRLILFEHRHN